MAEATAVPPTTTTAPAKPEGVKSGALTAGAPAPSPLVSRDRFRVKSAATPAGEISEERGAFRMINESTWHYTCERLKNEYGKPTGCSDHYRWLVPHAQRSELHLHIVRVTGLAAPNGSAAPPKPPAPPPAAVNRDSAPAGADGQTRVLLFDPFAASGRHLVEMLFARRADVDSGLARIRDIITTVRTGENSRHARDDSGGSRDHSPNPETRS